MRNRLTLFAVLLGTCAAPLSAQTWEDSRVERLAWPELSQFENEREFRNWVRDVRRVQREFNPRAEAIPENTFIVAQVDLEAEECADQEYCPDKDDNREIIVTASRAPSVNMSSPVAITTVGGESITNNQSAGVDEGDIVKRIGDYLLVLQDGRIFAANFRTMQLTDRIDVYRRDEDGDPIGADWYDEMLVEGDHILITAYSYNEDASELSVFRLDRATGRLERRGVFLISSEDYYDTENYATRVVGDKLVIYTPWEPEDLLNRRNRPVVRRWVSEDDYDEHQGEGEPILEASDIYRPVIGTLEPIIHTLSVCDLGDLEGETLDCQSTGFVGARRAEMFVAPDNIYLATTAVNSEDNAYSWDVCERLANGLPMPGNAPGVVFRMPMRAGADPDMLAVRGEVLNQFSMDERGNRFRGVFYSAYPECMRDADGNEWLPTRRELVDASIGSFTTIFRRAPDRRFAELPRIGGEGNYGENRFVGEWLLYGDRARYGRPPEDGEVEPNGSVMAVPIAAPERAAAVPLGHEITRIEAVGTDAVITGYRDDSGLNVSYLDLAATARLAGQTLLEGRFESESRSHAFGATIYAGGDGLLGLPSVTRVRDSDRYAWRSSQSALSFVRFAGDGALADLGTVDPAEPNKLTLGRYSCEVSCVDWYGNTRPIFIGTGVYALMGTQLVEARALADGMEVTRRLELASDLAR